MYGGRSVKQKHRMVQESVVGRRGMKIIGRMRRRQRIRKRVFGTSERPRLSVFRSARHIYAQVVVDVSGETLASASTLCREMRKEGKPLGNVDAARKVGELLAKRAAERGVKPVTFDRGGYRFHGRIKALAEAARENGLIFW